MEYAIINSDEFEIWWNTLSEPEMVDVLAYINLLEIRGPNLPYPYSSKINEAKIEHMRELRIQHKGKPYRVLYAFDPERKALLLIGGNKQGDKRWYKINVPIADKIYAKHIKSLKNKKEK